MPSSPHSGNPELEIPSILSIFRTGLNAFSYFQNFSSKKPLALRIPRTAHVSLRYGYFLEPPDSQFAFLSNKGDSLFFFSEGASADYIITGAWSAKAAKEVKNVVLGEASNIMACNCRVI